MAHYWLRWELPPSTFFCTGLHVSSGELCQQSISICHSHLQSKWVCKHRCQVPAPKGWVYQQSFRIFSLHTFVMDLVLSINSGDPIHRVCKFSPTLWESLCEVDRQRFPGTCSCQSPVWYQLCWAWRAQPGLRHLSLLVKAQMCCWDFRLEYKPALLPCTPVGVEINAIDSQLMCLGCKCLFQKATEDFFLIKSNSSWVLWLMSGNLSYQETEVCKFRICLGNLARPCIKMKWNQMKSNKYKWQKPISVEGFSANMREASCSIKLAQEIVSCSLKWNFLLDIWVLSPNP